jgi:hypothetical protein
MRVYHLLSAENALSDIALKRIRISRFRDLNDPFELLAAKQDDRTYRAALRSWREEFNEDHGLLCFSKDWKSPVLWSHYASKHRGICLGFHLSDQLAKGVRYTKDRLPIRFADNDPSKGLEESFVLELLTTKYQHWEYEDEVRVLLSLDHEECEAGSYFKQFDNHLRLAEVILGPHCDLPIARIRSLVERTYKSVPVVKARLAFKWFEVCYDERSARAENERWTKLGRSPPYRPTPSGSKPAEA